MSVAQAQNLRELLDSQGRKASWVAAQIGVHPSHFTRQVLDLGRVNALERDKLAEVLGLSPEQIDAVLAETARRPGKGEAA